MQSWSNYLPRNLGKMLEKTSSRLRLTIAWLIDNQDDDDLRKVIPRAKQILLHTKAAVKNDLFWTLTLFYKGWGFLLYVWNQAFLKFCGHNFCFCTRPVLYIRIPIRFPSHWSSKAWLSFSSDSPRYCWQKMLNGYWKVTYRFWYYLEYFGIEFLGLGEKILFLLQPVKHSLAPIRGSINTYSRRHQPDSASPTKVLSVPELSGHAQDTRTCLSTELALHYSSLHFISATVTKINSIPDETRTISRLNVFCFLSPCTTVKSLTVFLWWHKRERPSVL